jgi:hypothetical protein
VGIFLAIEIIAQHSCSVIWAGVFLVQSKRAIISSPAHGPEFDAVVY